MVADDLPVGLNFDVKIRFKLPNSFRDVLVYYFISRSFVEILFQKLLPVFFLTVLTVVVLNLLNNLPLVFPEGVK